MLKVIFDTNIYGLLFTEKDGEQIEKKIIEDNNFIVYGYKPIRTEIRNIRKVTKLSKKTRIRLLCLYDRITGNHFLENSLKITNLARKYYDHYRHLGGTYGWNTSIRIDFMIVACASFHGLDIVYSADNKTLMGKMSQKAYQHINLRQSLRTPNLLKYQDLIKKYRELS